MKTNLHFDQDRLANLHPHGVMSLPVNPRLDRCRSWQEKQNEATAVV